MEMPKLPYNVDIYIDNHIVGSIPVDAVDEKEAVTQAVQSLKTKITKRWTP